MWNATQINPGFSFDLVLSAFCFLKSKPTGTVREREREIRERKQSVFDLVYLCIKRERVMVPSHLSGSPFCSISFGP